MNYQVIIPAAGSGKRMGAGFNKLFLEMKSRPIIAYTLDVFVSDTHCEKIILVIQETDREMFNELLKQYTTDIEIVLVVGGDERQDSVYAGMCAADPHGIVLVHDGARPFIDHLTIHQLVESADATGAAIAAVPVKDTIKKVANMHVIETVERSSLWQIQTPQAFHYSILMRAHEQAKQDRYLGTDEASLVERIDEQSVQIVTAHYDNIKLTTQEDLFFADAILTKRKAQNG